MKLPQFPDNNINILFYVKVNNASEIRSKVAELPYAFIDASTICSVEQLMSAIFKVMIEKTYNRLRTRALHSETILALSPTSNIGNAFQKFGIKEDTKEIIIVQVSEEYNSEIDGSVVDGEVIEFSDENLKKFYDVDTIRKIYNLDKSFESKTDAELSRAIVDAIQLRGL